MRESLALLGLVAAAFVSARATAQEEAATLLLLTRDAEMRSVRLASINDQSLVHMDVRHGWVTLSLSQCVALLNPRVQSIGGESRGASRGLVVLADGQRLPGEAADGAPAQADTLAWNHPWLGRLDVPFRLIESVLLRADAEPPAPGQADVVLLANGDRQEGIVTAIGDPVVIETGEGATLQTLEIPLSRVVAIRMIAPRQSGNGKRVWFIEGSVLDVRSIALGEDGLVRMADIALQPRGQAPQVSVDEIAAILFDRERLTPLASLTPSRVEGPPTRYILPRPVVVEGDAPLGLSPIDFSGPLLARYALPAGCERFVAEAELPRTARQWGDCELIVRSDDREVFRARLSATSPAAAINVPLHGRELTIEIAAGAHGPIQDAVRLHRALLLKAP